MKIFCSFNVKILTKVGTHFMCFPRPWIYRNDLKGKILVLFFFLLLTSLHDKYLCILGTNYNSIQPRVESRDVGAITLRLQPNQISGDLNLS